MPPPNDSDSTSSHSSMLVLARLLVEWHRRLGVERAHDLPPAARRPYLIAVEGMPVALDSIDECTYVARQQLDGPLALFAEAPLPQFLTDSIPTLLLERLGQSPTLAAIGESILAGREFADEETGAQATDLASNVLPAGWERSAVPLRANSFDLQSAHNPEGIARFYAALLAPAQRYGLGGIDLMVAAHTDTIGEEETTSVVFSPASYNFQLATGPGTLATRVMDGEIELQSVTVGVPRDWLGRRRED